MTAICKIGAVELDYNLTCHGIYLPTQTYKPVYYVGGGKAVQQFAAPVYDLELEAYSSGRTVSALITYAQIKALRALPDGVPQLFLHPTATAAGATGITVIVDKSTLAHPHIKQADSDMGGCNNPSDTHVYIGKILLYRIT
jgi:hypothetical protein